MEKVNIGFRTFVVNPEGNLKLWRPKPRWEDNIKIDIKETGCEDVS